MNNLPEDHNSDRSPLSLPGPNISFRPIIWAMNDALLSLGELCYAATTHLDGSKVGDTVFSPFQLTLSGLTPGKHTLEVDVFNTMANSIFGKQIDMTKVLFSNINQTNKMS